MKKGLWNKYIIKIMVMMTIILGSFFNFSSAYAVVNPTIIDTDSDVSGAEVECCPVPECVHGLLGAYYDTSNPTKTSYERLIRIDDNPEFNWQLGSPDPAIEPETFSNIWTGFIEVPTTGTYTFYTYSDDGVRLTINDKKIINRWSLVNLEFTTSQKIKLQAGLRYKFEMQYQNIPFNSTVFLFWQRNGGEMNIVPPSAFWVSKADYNKYITPKYVNSVKGKGDGLQGEYFIGANGVGTGNTPVYTTNNQNINYLWGSSSPNISVPCDDFSARWSGYIEAKYSEPVNLQVLCDDGVRMWINDQLVLDKWVLNSDIEYQVPVNMVVGQFYKIKIEYNDIEGGATCILFWNSEGQEKEVIPVKYLYSLNSE